MTRTGIDYTDLGYDAQTTLQQIIFEMQSEIEEKQLELGEAMAERDKRKDAVELFQNITVARRDLEKNLELVKDHEKWEKRSDNAASFQAQTIELVMPQFDVVIQMVNQVLTLQPDLQRLENHSGQEWLDLHDKLMNERLSYLGRWTQWLSDSPGRSPGTAAKEERSSGSSSLKLKKLDYPQFYGSVKLYAKFLKDYNCLVVPENTDERQRAIILTTQCLHGEALQATSHMIEESKILNELRVRWGAEADLVDEVENSIKALKPCTSYNNAFMVFIDQLRGLYSDLQQVGMETEVSNLSILQSIIKKLPFKAKS